jgi:hypothetical protein
MSKETGGPAFPAETDFEYFHGMTLRDYFAAKAMQGLVIDKSFVDLYTSGARAVAQQAYLVANAMLEARK